MIEVVKVSESGDKLLCRCPLHEDDKASLLINLDSEWAHCFAGCCSEPLVDFVAKVYKLNRVMARMKIETLFDLSAAKQSRNFDPEDLKDWILAENEEFLLNRGFKSKIIADWNIEICSGILRFPTYAVNRKLQGYQYRVIAEKNFWMTPGLRRRVPFYGMQAFNNHNPIIVEGPLDCIWLHQHGIHSALAMLGNEISDNQIEFLERFPKVYLSLDNDFGGENGIARMKKFFNNLKIIKYDYGDPQEIPSNEVKKVYEKYI